ncbi:hypothetical protein B4135_1574 [Caldibacillus debilis]|uniref:Uncharacterized protein n=1 Tax=Caldibacillus debilis TaxID=301148 RepID=A0A150MC16_9BACI|nr:hypothetical protein B4135_1574 [Caldibacillus debilis]
MRARGPRKDQVLLWVKSRTRPEKQSLPERGTVLSPLLFTQILRLHPCKARRPHRKTSPHPPHGKMPPSAGAGKPQDG